MPTKRPRFPPEYAAVCLQHPCTEKATSTDKVHLLEFWARHGLDSRNPSLLIAEDAKHETCSVTRNHADTHNSKIANILSERAPIPYAPLILKWPHPAVLDLLVQQAQTPFDPCLSMCSVSQRPDFHILRALDNEQRVAAEVLSLVEECSVSSKKGQQEKPEQDSYVTRLEAALVTLGHEGALYNVPATMMPMWDKVSAEPVGGLKNVVYFALCPEHLVPLTHMFLRDVCCEYESCKLGTQTPGSSSPNLRVLSGVLPIPLKASSDLVKQQGGGARYHPVLGTSTNHAVGFHPGLDSHLSHAASTTSADYHPSMEPSSFISNTGSVTATSAAGQDMHFCRNLRYTLDMLQRHLLLNPLPEPLVKTAPDSVPNNVAGNISSSCVRDAASIVIYIIPPTQEKGAVARMLLEAVCRLSPVTPEGYTSASSSSKQRSNQDAHTATSATADSATVAPSTPPLKEAAGSEAEMIASEVLHLKQQLEQAALYFGAASENYFPVLPSGTRGSGAAGGTSNPTPYPLPVPPTLPSLTPTNRLSITLQPISLSMLQDVTGDCARATAFSVYSKLRPISKGLDFRDQTDQQKPVLNALYPASAPEPSLPKHCDSIALPDPQIPQSNCGASSSGSSLQHPSFHKCVSGWHMLSASNPLTRVYEPLTVLAEPDIALHPGRDPMVSPESTVLYCSYAWHLTEMRADLAAPGCTHQGSLSTVWCCICWTDDLGELLEAKSVTLMKDTASTLTATADDVEAVTLGPLAGPYQARTQASAAEAVSQVVAAETNALMQRLDATCRREQCLFSDSISDVSSSERCVQKSLFSCVIVTKVGGWSVGEEAAWQELRSESLQVPSVTSKAEATGIRDQSSLEAAGRRDQSSLKAAGRRDQSSLEAAGRRDQSSLEAAGRRDQSSLEAAGRRDQSSLEAAGRRDQSSLEAAGRRDQSSLEATGRRDQSSLLDIEPPAPSSYLRSPCMSWIVTCIDEVAGYPVDSSLMNLPVGNFLIKNMSSPQSVPFVAATASQHDRRPTFESKVLSNEPEERSTTLQVVAMPQGSDLEVDSADMTDQVFSMRMRMLDLGMNYPLSVVDLDTPEGTRCPAGKTAPFSPLRSVELALHESPSCTEPASSVEKFVAQKLLSLTQLSTALCSLGRHRQVGIRGLERILPYACERGDTSSFMPVHCHTAQMLLWLCLACESVVEGETNW
ncbi:hypothetical protein CEUSTIGMA_g8702.t1 [Chlamydomonas eustigma]|uniref:Mediator of RNA polymerase II transcription subunit 13 n=1 Tax=Chlamydomonas eustigma TaxID=1157962 RepID=A0A250XEQ4_9CHLO|nr:hypothetical protein CEUSTIGMA_g8702.t1 [Chlamydomonas eustigma]|eukprot:GAX81270.1 hypothetical protein CEUSTIGMA_g8702.t1 [Chlamydomonas eustigma]